MSPPFTLQLMDLTSLIAVLGELRQELLPSRFEKAQQIEAQSLQLGFRTLHNFFWIELSWRADAPRLVQIPPPPKNKSESTLAKQLQCGLRHMALVEIKQEGFERIVEFIFAIRPGEACYRTLVLEIMGRHSNLLLLDQQKKVITLGRQIRNHHSRVRPIATGDKYVSPPGLKGKIPNPNDSFMGWKQSLFIKGKSLKQSLLETYQGISPSLVLQFAGEDLQEAKGLVESPVEEILEEQWKSVHKRWALWLKQIHKKNFNIRFNGPTPFRVWGGRFKQHAIKH